jgi:nucleoside-diphosphate-sugar epimerase
MKINTLYGTLINYLSSNQSLKFGACNSQRDMLYISDFCHSIELIIKQTIPLSGVLNIGSGHTRSNKDFILDFARKNNIPESVIHFDEGKIENNIMSEDYSLSIQKAKEILNWTPRNS